MVMTNDARRPNTLNDMPVSARLAISASVKLMPAVSLISQPEPQPTRSR